MELTIEKWAKVNMEEASLPLFEEAVKCYKIGAYQSAYLMSYLSFKITIRHRIINTKYKPEAYGVEDWETEIIENLENEDWWEKTVNNIILSDPNNKKERNKMKEKGIEFEKKLGKMASIFNFKNRELAINKYNYFKDIRNSSAHARKETINAATVEQFWNYLQDNLSSFFVLGGQEYLISEITNAYKYKNTNEYSEKLNQLLLNVSIVFKSNSYNCFEEAFKNVLIIFEEKDKEFWSKFINSSSDNIQVGFMRYLMKNTELFSRFFGFFPEILTKSYTIDEKFIQDKISEYLKFQASYDEVKQKIYWSLIIECLCKYSDLIDLKDILKGYTYGIPSIEFTKKEIEVFQKKEVFNKILLNPHYIRFFDVEWEHIAQKIEYIEVEATGLFKYACLNKELIVILNKAINRLEDRKSSNSYGSWERTRSRLFEKIVEENRENINIVINRDNIVICDKMKEYMKHYQSMEPSSADL